MGLKMRRGVCNKKFLWLTFPFIIQNRASLNSQKYAFYEKFCKFILPKNFFVLFLFFYGWCINRHSTSFHRFQFFVNFFFSTNFFPFSHFSNRRKLNEMWNVFGTQQYVRAVIRERLNISSDIKVVAYQSCSWSNGAVIVNK